MLKTLLVEDNGVVRALIKEMLKFKFPSMTILEARNGKEAFRIAEEFSPDLVLMDVRLPDESGLSVTRRIKNLSPKAIVFILTSYDLPEYREAASREGALCFLVKGEMGVDGVAAMIRSVFPNSVAPM